MECNAQGLTQLPPMTITHAIIQRFVFAEEERNFHKQSYGKDNTIQHKGTKQNYIKFKCSNDAYRKELPVKNIPKSACHSSLLKGSLLMDEQREEHERFPMNSS